MSKNQLFIFISLIVGLLADLCLRLITVEEGNLLVHSVVFFIGFVITYGILRIGSKRDKRG
ncbi:hypothetical protein CIRMBP1196_01649 [Enterococcus cecorum]|uniref:Uncharacterized protein n=1 Tax=Enterococcus cecorum TaxID=44008 RepID=A0A1Y4QVT0_9ENTE|nr:hypothetical protein B5E88_10620 [Enterococcus cecorum]CAI3257167.1 hypothetical protein CIRMBP1216_00094 [Enterococcus cecorum]CAI3258281.1 hypothetical protein CIRMBP1248_00115 [Enterococcus cecorum]CAI3258390.1 hypothetical protein CIRMBP1218_00095 [Enterococcus cecorum]CAI3258622.1 hypothetical protein CIRMBP1229_00096 [Enterococcus cecorum]